MLGDEGLLIAKMLYVRKVSNSPKGVKGVTTVYGIEVDRWNLIIYNDAFAFCAHIRKMTSGR